MYTSFLMSENLKIPFEENLIKTLKLIGTTCISKNAEIEPGVNIVLESSPDKTRQTYIGEVHLNTGVEIGGQVQLEDGVQVDVDAKILFRAFVGRDSIIGKDSTIGVGSIVEQNTVIMPNSNVGNFSYISENSLIGWATKLNGQVFIGPGLSVKGNIGSHSEIKSIKQ